MCVLLYIRYTSFFFFLKETRFCWNTDHKTKRKAVRDKAQNEGECLIMQTLQVLLRMMVFMLMEMERHWRVSSRVIAGFALQLVFILFRRASWLVCRKQIRKESKVVLGTNDTVDWVLAVEVKKKRCLLKLLSLSWMSFFLFTG